MSQTEPPIELDKLLDELISESKGYGYAKPELIKAKIIAHQDQIVKEYKAACVKKNQSLCGCPMCEHHTSAYELQANNTEGEADDTK